MNGRDEEAVAHLGSRAGDDLLMNKQLILYNTPALA